MNPLIALTIIDSESTVGGVWAASRCFPGFYADSPVGCFDFSDLDMSATIGLKDWSELPGEKVYEYLQKYAEKFELDRRCKFNTTVVKVERGAGNTWRVETHTGEVLECDKLIIASGLTSRPSWPNLDTEAFKGLVIHSKDVGKRHQALTGPDVENVTVYGGCKSAIDTISLCISAGKHVDWIIREDGNGPGMMAEVRLRGGIHGAMLAGRWKNILTPSIFSVGGFWYNFLMSGKNRFGSWLFKTFWAKASVAPLKMGPYSKKCENAEKLMPETGEYVSLIPSFRHSFLLI